MPTYLLAASVDCRVAGAAVSLDDSWAAATPQLGVEYRPPGAFLFDGSVSTACGEATSASGFFYCPADESVHLDTGFYDDLRSRFGASGGPLAEMYVVAHEWGRHIQNLTGALAASQQGGTGPDSGAVRVELQADCYAGAWAAAASSTESPDGNAILEPITQQQLRDALDAASSIGDDRIQEQTTGAVNPETWSHGSSEQRERWFQVGFDEGVLACDTFAVNGDQL